MNILQSDEHISDAGAFGFLDKTRDFVTLGIHLNGGRDIQLFLLPKLDQFVEDRLPILISGEIVVGNEKPFDTLLIARPNQAGDILRTSSPGFLPLDVNDRTEAALEGAAASGIKTGIFTKIIAHLAVGQGGHRGALQGGKVLQEIIDGL